MRITKLVLAFFLLLCITSNAQGWEYVASTHFDRLDGATTELKAFQNPFNGLVRIQLEQSGGRVQGVHRRSMVLSKKEAESFVGMGFVLLSGDSGNTPTITAATKYGETLVYGKVFSEHEGSYLTLAIHSTANPRDGVGTPIGFGEHDYSNLRAFLQTLERNL